MREEGFIRTFYHADESWKYLGQRLLDVVRLSA